MKHTLMMTLATIVACSATPCFAESAEIPSYADQVKARNTRLSKRPPIPPADKAIMQNAADALEKAMPSPGLSVGDTAPDFTLPDANGANVSLKDALKGGPVVLTFYRGAWCPYCRMQLHTMQQIAPRLEALNARMLAITPQTPDRSREQAAKEKLDFPILSDLDNRVMQAYRLHVVQDKDLNELYRTKFNLDISAYNGNGRLDLPVPATYVIDTSGTVRAAFADTDYKNRMEPIEILKALESINKDAN